MSRCDHAISGNQPDHYDRVMSFLAAHSPATATDIGVALGLTQARVFLVLHAAERNGAVQHQDRGPHTVYPLLWSMTPAYQPGGK